MKGSDQRKRRVGQPINFAGILRIVLTKIHKIGFDQGYEKGFEEGFKEGGAELRALKARVRTELDALRSGKTVVDETDDEEKAPDGN